MRLRKLESDEEVERQPSLRIFGNLEARQEAKEHHSPTGLGSCYSDKKYKDRADSWDWQRRFLEWMVLGLQDRGPDFTLSLFDMVLAYTDGWMDDEGIRKGNYLRISFGGARLDMALDGDLGT